MSSPTTKKSLLIQMKDQGLVTIRLEAKPRRTYHITLTELGHGIAVHMKEANDQLNGHIVKHPENTIPQPSRQLLDPHLSLVLRVVYERQHLTLPELSGYTKLAEAELRSNLDALVADGSVRTEGDQYLITGDGAKRARHVIAMEHGEDVVETDYEEPAAGGAETKGSG